LKRRDFIDYLIRHGCVLSREGSDHSWWFNPAANRGAAVPRHRDIIRHLAKTICKELGIPPTSMK